MLGKIFENEIVISKKLENYINDITGFIDCGKEEYIGDNLIINLEQVRIESIRNNIINLILTFFQKNPTKHKSMLYQTEINSLELEILINHSVIDILKSILNDVRNRQHYYRNKMTKTAGIKLEMNRRINRRFRYYGDKIENLIFEREQYLNNLNEFNILPFDFANSTMISHRKKLKIRERKV